MRLTAALATVLIALTGCGGTSFEPGTKMVGSNYTFTLPEGWGEKDLPGLDLGPVDTFAFDLNDKDGFADNVNVVKEGPVLTWLPEAKAKRDLESIGAEDVTIEDRVMVARNQAPHLSGTLSVGGDHRFEQYYLADFDEVYWVVTFSFSPTVGSSEGTELAESVLATWEWGTD
jgi:hypothetical protein